MSSVVTNEIPNMYFRCLLLIYCHLSTNEKLSRKFSVIYGVTSYGSGWRKETYGVTSYGSGRRKESYDVISNGSGRRKESYDVISNGSGCRKEVVNQCLEFEAYVRGRCMLSCA